MRVRTAIRGVWVVESGETCGLTIKRAGAPARAYNQGRFTMTPQKTITLADDVYEQVKLRADAEGKTLEETANEAVRLGLHEDRWQRLVKRGRNYSREMAEAATDEEAIQIAVDAVHESRAEQRSRR